MSSGNPVLVEKDGTLTPLPDLHVGRTQLLFTRLSSVKTDATGRDFIQTVNAIGYYDAQSKAFVSCAGRPQFDNIFGFTFDANNNLVITGSMGKVPFIAIQNGEEWQIVELCDQFPESEAFVSFADFHIANAGGKFPISSLLHSPVLARDGSIWMLNGYASAQKLVRFSDGTIEVIADQAPGGDSFNYIDTDVNGNIIYSTDSHIGLIDVKTRVFNTLIEEGAKLIAVDSEAVWYNFVSGNAIRLIAELKRYDLSSKHINTYGYNAPIEGEISSLQASKAGELAIVSRQELFILQKSEPVQHDGWSVYQASYMNIDEFLKYGYLDVNHSGLYPVSVGWSQADNNSRMIGVHKEGGTEFHRMNVGVEVSSLFYPKGTRPNTACYTSKGILVGTDNDGLMLLDPTHEQELAVHVRGYDPQANGKQVNAIVEDRNRVIWLGTNNGLVKYENDTFTLYNKKNKSAFSTNKAVNCLHVTPDNVLWIGTSGDGLFSFDGTNWTQYTKKEGLQGNNIARLAGVGETVYAVDVSLLGSTQHLHTIVDGKISSERLPFLVGSNNLTVDEQNNLWIAGTTQGVLCRHADGAQTIYNASISPVGYGDSKPGTYSMNAFYINGKLYVTRTYTPLIKTNMDEDLYNKYNNKVNTFDWKIAYVLDLE
ncbi:hypothetical protein LJB87_01055 [Alistipes sp. OttesenSCG-928-L06]|nr:hypothetical protein [Alistipes sp. OttesenSCG-928-L06]